MIIPNPQPVVQNHSRPRSFSTSVTFQAGIFFFLSAILLTGCVSKEQYEAEKARGLNFQRLLVQEENRANALNDKLEQKDKEINALNAQLKETKDKIASLESRNRDLTVDLNALKEQNQRQPVQEPVPGSPALSKDHGSSKDKPLSEPSFSEPSLSDPFMSEEDLLNILGPQPK